MIIQEVKNSMGEDVVIVIDENSNTATSMLKSTYDEMIAKQNEANTL